MHQSSPRDNILRFLNDGTAIDIFGILPKLSENRKSLLKKKDVDGDTALIKASRDGLTDLVGLFMTFGSDLNARNSSGRTALMEAISNGHIDVIPLLMASKTTINLRDNNGDSALTLACQHRHDAIVTALLNAGADVHAKDESGRGCLYHACHAGSRKLVSILLEVGCDVNEGKRWCNPLVVAACFGHSEIVSLLIEAGADYQRIGCRRSILFFMSENYVGETEGELEKILLILIAAGVDVNAVNSDDSTVLMEAFNYGNMEMVKSLIKVEVDVNYKNKSGTTALMVAMKVGCPDFVAALISAGANVNAYDKNGVTALMIGSTSYNGDPLIAALLDAGADVLFKNMDGKTALDLARSDAIRNVFRAHVDKLISDSSTTIPKSFVCPITQEVMKDPVICTDGHSYERTCILRWFETKNTSPITNAALDDKTLIPNHALRSSIQEFLAEATKRASLKKKKHILKDKTNRR